MSDLLAGGAHNRSVPCILVVEDEFLVAEMLEQMLEDLGYRSIKAGRVPQAIDLAATAALDGAILDLNLAGVEVYPVADELRRRGIPLVFSTGSGPDGLRPDYRGWPMLSKPYLADDLQRVLAATLASPVVEG
jgi:CheY-like chemotaxis protein